MHVSDKPGGPGSKGKSTPTAIVPNTNKHATQGKIKMILYLENSAVQSPGMSLHFVESCKRGFLDFPE